MRWSNGVRALLVLVMVVTLVGVGVPGMAPTEAIAADGVLTWNPNTDVDLAGYRIYFGAQSCSAQGPLAPLMVGGTAVQLGLVTTYRHVGLPVIDGTLCWEVTAFDTSGNESARSVRVSKEVNQVPPPAPTGLSVAIQ